MMKVKQNYSLAKITIKQNRATLRLIKYQKGPIFFCGVTIGLRGISKMQIDDLRDLPEMLRRNVKLIYNYCKLYVTGMVS